MASNMEAPPSDKSDVGEQATASAEEDTASSGQQESGTGSSQHDAAEPLAVEQQGPASGTHPSDTSL